MLVYAFVRIIIPYGARLLPLYVFAFACCVELLQYWKIIEILGLSGNAIARTVIGTSFSWMDIICYGAGCGVCWLCQQKLKLFSPNINNRNG
jgi:hypothetical protein